MLKFDSNITLDYGAGGRKMHRLIAELFLKHFKNPVLTKLEDAAELSLLKDKPDFCLTIDSYVVQPLFFPGGDIGKLSICGTVNDLAVKGARPLFIAISFVLQEGLKIATLEKICQSIAQTARSVPVTIITGDTKVIERRHEQEELIITTCGVGKIDRNFQNPTLGADNIKVGDIVLINGGIGEHESAVVIARGDYQLRAKIKSDCAPLFALITQLAKAKCKIKMMRDPTRGGLATTLNEIADAGGVSIVLNESAIPIKKSVKGVADMLGVDPLYMANEGKVVIIADPKDKNKIINIMKKHPLGKDCAVIGEVSKRQHGLGVWLRTKIGSERPVLQLEGVQIPRIC
ncbi:MAG: hydrogenase expression/formation protein HypE [candidate division WOR-3 bacterium]|nr:hydrogenase expression/formation protein HypE [candidate division WOR-3 bacterium]